MYREGEDKPVASQLDIIDTLPGEKGYNDFRQVWKVWVPKDYVANTITDASMLQQAGYKMEKTDKLLNMAVVPDKSRARVRFNGGNPELQRAWYHDQVAKFFLFDEAPLSVSGDKVPVSPIYDGFTINPGQSGGEMGFSQIPTPPRLTTSWLRCRAIKLTRRCGCGLSTIVPLAPRYTTSTLHSRRRWSLPKCC